MKLQIATLKQDRQLYQTSVESNIVPDIDLYNTAAHKNQIQ